MLLVILCLLAPLRTGDQHPDGLKSFGWLAGLAGACWEGSSEGKVTDTQCYEVELDRFLLGSIEIGSPGVGKPPGFKGRAIFAWNATAARIDYWQWASDGSYRQAEAFVDGDRIVFPMPGSAGRPPERTVWSRATADSFSVVRERQQGAGWLPVLRVTYRRVSR